MFSKSSMELFSALVAAPSASCADPRYDQGNLEAAGLLGARLEALGFEVGLTELPGSGGAKGNLLARRGGDGEAGLALCGHLDTVPCDPGAWSGDPYRLEQRDGRFYGLGACDMKGFFRGAGGGARWARPGPAAPATVCAGYGQRGVRHGRGAAAVRTPGALCADR